MFSFLFFLEKLQLPRETRRGATAMESDKRDTYCCNGDMLDAGSQTVPDGLDYCHDATCFHAFCTVFLLGAVPYCPGLREGSLGDLVLMLALKKRWQTPMAAEMAVSNLSLRMLFAVSRPNLTLHHCLTGAQHLTWPHAPELFRHVWMSQAADYGGFWLWQRLVPWGCWHACLQKMMLVPPLLRCLLRHSLLAHSHW